MNLTKPCSAGLFCVRCPRNSLLQGGRLKLLRAWMGFWLVVLLAMKLAVMRTKMKVKMKAKMKVKMQAQKWAAMLPI